MFETLLLLFGSACSHMPLFLRSISPYICDYMCVYIYVIYIYIYLLVVCVFFNTPFIIFFSEQFVFTSFFRCQQAVAMRLEHPSTVVRYLSGIALIGERARTCSIVTLHALVLNFVCRPKHDLYFKES